MCGLAGIISTDGIDAHQLMNMGDLIAHRGPDDKGAMLYTPETGMSFGYGQDTKAFLRGPFQAGFIHHRLSIIDLSINGRQPMSFSGVALVFNGEIYNYRELRLELEAEGCVFSSAGDTETVLRAYLTWGKGCFARFQGMWALAILDTRRKTVVLSRDRFGIKPLYLSKTPNAIYFASEIKSLLANPDISRDVNESTVSRYLSDGSIDVGTETFFNAIHRFPAACWSEISLGETCENSTYVKYWDLPERQFQGTETDAIEHIRELFDKSIKVHHHSDVASGTCLSGGLDSSAIACRAKQLKASDDLSNHSWMGVGYIAKDPRYSEQSYMETVADESGIDLHCVRVSSEEFSSNLSDIIGQQDEPFGSPSVAAQWFVFREARKLGLKVMLDGQGSDEIFGGYLGYILNIARGLMIKCRVGAYRKLQSQYEDDIGKFPLHAYRVIGDAAIPEFLRSKLIKPGSDAPLFLSAGMKTHLKNIGLDESAARFSLDKTLRFDLTNRILPALLRYEDRNSMAHSIEARVPFLDHRLVDFAFTLPDDMKIKGIQRKYIFNEAMKGVVPEAVRSRKDKISFRADPAWALDYYKNNMASLLENKSAEEKKWFNIDGVKAIADKALSSGAGERALWRIVNAKLWVRQL